MYILMLKEVNDMLLSKKAGHKTINNKIAFVLKLKLYYFSRFWKYEKKTQVIQDSLKFDKDFWFFFFN